MDTMKHALIRLWDRTRTRYYTRPCNGRCGSPDPHSHHLTRAGRRRYTGGR